MMNVILYQYNDRERVVNKYNTGNAMVEVANINLTPYGKFDWNDITFTLKKMYKCNYATYIYNGIKYSGYVTVSVRADGLNEYHITNDPLTTCWENGCFNSASLCVYSSVGDSPVMDTRVMRNAKPKVLTYESNVHSSSPSPYFIITTMQVPNKNTYKRYPNNPCLKSWILNVDNFNNLQLDLLTAAKVTMPDFPTLPEHVTIDSILAYMILMFGYTIRVGTVEKDAASVASMGSTIVGCYCLEEYDVPNTSMFSGSEQLELISINQTGVHKLSDLAEKYSGAGWQPVYATPIVMSSEVNNPKVESAIRNIECGLTYDNYKEDTDFTLQIPHMGEIKFNWASIYNRAEGGINYISSIGYKKIWDFASGFCKAELVINGNIICPDYYISAPIPMKAPIFVDENVRSYRQDVSNAIGAFLGNANQTLSSIPGAVTNPASAVSTIASSNLNAVSSKIAAYESLLNTQIAETAEAQTSVTGMGGSLDFSKNPTLIVKYKEPINHWAIGNYYGFPDGQARYLNSIKGYVQTQGCKLFINGLPQDLVQKAEGLCDDGVYIL